MSNAIQIAPFDATPSSEAGNLQAFAELEEIKRLAGKLEGLLCAVWIDESPEEATAFYRGHVEEALKMPREKLGRLLDLAKQKAHGRYPDLEVFPPIDGEAETECKRHG